MKSKGLPNSQIKESFLVKKKKLQREGQRYGLKKKKRLQKLLLGF